MRLFYSANNKSQRKCILKKNKSNGQRTCERKMEWAITKNDGKIVEKKYKEKKRKYKSYKRQNIKDDGNVLCLIIKSGVMVMGTKHNLKP